jgi:hypothetical protein
MKLLLCPFCNNIINLTKDKKYCPCGECYGVYLSDGDHALVSEYAVIFGIDNNSYTNALSQYYDCHLQKKNIYSYFVGWFPSPIDDCKVIREELAKTLVNEEQVQE